MTTYTARICSWVDSETVAALATVRERGHTVSEVIRAGLVLLLGEALPMGDEASHAERATRHEDAPQVEGEPLGAPIVPEQSEALARVVAGIPEAVDLAWVALLELIEAEQRSACDRDLIESRARLCTCEPAPDQKQDPNRDVDPPRSRARCFDPANTPQDTANLDPSAIVELWNEKRKTTADRWSLVNLAAGRAGYLRTPSPAVLGEALRRRLAHASRRIGTLDAWASAFDALANVPPFAVNRLFLWDLDRLCRLPLEANEQEAFRALPPEDRPCFAERLPAYASWVREKAPPSPAVQAPAVQAPAVQAPPAASWTPKKRPPQLRFAVVELDEAAKRRKAEASRLEVERLRAQSAERAARLEAARLEAARLREAEEARERSTQQLRALRAKLFGGAR